MRIVLLGPPGSGKGTQAEVLKDQLSVVHISTGVLLRKAVAAGTPLGIKAKSAMDAGELVSDELMLDLIEERLGGEDVVSGFILDGFPRNQVQAKALDQMLSELGQPLQAALAMTVDEEEIIARLARRAAEEGRSDDTEDVIRNRMRVYREQTAPITDHYRRQGLLREVDGMGSIEEVNARLRAALS